MALVPFYMLEGNIEQVKELSVGETQIEKWYEDEDGNRAVIILDRTT